MLVKEKNMNKLFQSCQILFCFFMKKENNNLPLEKYQDVYFILFFFFKSSMVNAFLYYLVSQAMLADVKEKYGRDIRVFETSTTSHTPNEVSNSGMNDLWGVIPRKWK